MTLSIFIVLIVAIVSFAFDFQIIVFQILTLLISTIVILNIFLSIVIEKFFAISISNLIMLNNVIIHQFADTNTLIVIINEFFALWTNVDFVELLKKNWMRIFLKSNWKNRVFEIKFLTNCTNKNVCYEQTFSFYLTISFFAFEKKTSSMKTKIE